MENNNIFIGKIEKAGCYVNNGKYGYFITCNKKNYKLPEFLLPEEVTLDMAKRIIAYKNKISEQWLEKKENIQNKVKVKMMIMIMMNHLKKKWF